MSNKCRTCVFSFNAIPDKRYEGTFEGKGTIGSSIKHVWGKNHDSITNESDSHIQNTSQGNSEATTSHRAFRLSSRRYRRANKYIPNDLRSKSWSSAYARRGPFRARTYSTATNTPDFQHCWQTGQTVADHPALPKSVLFEWAVQWFLPPCDCYSPASSNHRTRGISTVADIRERVGWLHK